jgi:hypothetical protein
MKNTKYTVDGLHLIMAVNQKGGASKTTTIAETAVGLSDLGIPLLIVNLEVTEEDSSTANQRLRTMLRGTQIINLDCSDVSKVLKELGKILQVARRSGAVVLMDIPGAMMTVGNGIWKNIQKTQYLRKVDSLTLIGTVTNERDHFNTALHITNAISHVNKKVFYRGWDNPLHTKRLQDMDEWKEVTKVYPSVLMPTRWDLCEDVVFGREEYTNAPGLLCLRDWFAKEELEMDLNVAQPIELVLQSLDVMTDFLRKNYLPIICK